ncbi:MAG: DUF11 domain-containing protein [Acidimicrobiales bacterium]
MVHIARVDIAVDKSITPVEVDADATNGPYWFGSYVNYTVVVDNAGPDGATNVSLSDVLDPAALAFDSVVLVTQGSFDSGTNIWTVGSIANGRLGNPHVADPTGRSRLGDQHRAGRSGRSVRR